MAKFIVIFGDDDFLVVAQVDQIATPPIGTEYTNTFTVQNGDGLPIWIMVGSKIRSIVNDITGEVVYGDPAAEE